MVTLGRAGLAAMAVAAAVSVSDAQVIGTFSWRTQPYCNIVTVTVIQQGGVYQLVGADNLCGTGTAPITGTAVPTGAGVAFGFSAALPTGGTAHLSATISLATLSGTWTDADGNTGSFAFGSPAAGSPRPPPAPTTAITVNQFAPSVYAGSGSATTLARSDHDHDTRYYTKTEDDNRRPLLGFGDSVMFVDITNSTVVTSVPLVAPVAGTIIAHGVTTILDGTGIEYSCSLSLAGVFDLNYSQYAAPQPGLAGVIATVRHFPVPAGSHTVSLVCDSSGSGNGFAARPKLSVVFHPN
jgi:hypothetical protein